MTESENEIEETSLDLAHLSNFSSDVIGGIFIVNVVIIAPKLLFLSILIVVVVVFIFIIVVVVALAVSIKNVAEGDRFKHELMFSSMITGNNCNDDDMII